MRYLSRYSCLPMLFAAMISHGATPYEGELPIELARYFVGGGVFYSDIPDGFPEFTLPAGLQVVGALNQGQRTQVILTTVLEPTVAQQALVEAFLSRDGWTRRSTRRAEAQRPRGFVEQGLIVETPPLQPAQLCHDSYGVMSIEAGLADGAISIGTSGAPDRGWPGCAQEREMEQRAVANNTNAITQHLPTIEVPAGNVNRDGMRAVANDPISATSEFRTGMRISAEKQSLKRLNRNFASQMRQQGWRRDKQWSGNLSAGSNWTLQTDDDQQLSVFLSIIQLAENDYELDLKLLVLD